MRTAALHAVSLAALLLIAGCAGAPAPGGSPPSPHDTPAESPATSPESAQPPTANQPSTPAIQSLPTVESCASGALPDPNGTDGLSPSPYPEPPATVSNDSVANYTADFEEAYFRNRIIAEAAGDDMNLTRVSTHARPRNVTRTRDGYVVVLAVSAGTKYEGGVHGDRWPTIGYFVNDTVLVREHVESPQARVGVASGTVVLRCEE